jgi:hypothetical protein
MLRRLLTYAILIYLSWLAMQAVHELGHILAAWLTGGTVERVILEPLAISRTDVSPNPSPLAVAWAGPLVGVALPLFLATLWHWRFRSRGVSGAIADAAQVPLRRVVDPRLPTSQLPPLRTPLAKPRKSLPNRPKIRPRTQFFAPLKPSSHAPRQLSCHVPTCLHDAEPRYPKPGGDRSRYR